MSQASKGSFGLVQQSLSGNKNNNDGIQVVYAGYITSFSGSAGSEQALVNKIADRGGRAGDWCFFFCGIGNGANANGAVSGNLITGWSNAQIIWTPGYGYDSAYAHKTMDQLDVMNTDTKFLARAAYPVFMVILRNRYGPLLTASLKQIVNYQGASTLTFNGITKDRSSKGLFAIGCDRDTTGTWGAPAGWNAYNANNNSPFSIAAIDCRNPRLYKDGDPIVIPITAGLTYDQIGLLFELT